jgi:putative (di)nucleoside polyphosphate hydrolase
MTTIHPVNGMKYQPNVAAILRHRDGRIFIGERVADAGAWQFPQGGVDSGEGLEAAMKRELWEEIGVLPEHYRFVGAPRGPYYYLFPNGYTKRGQNGKEQHYFLCDFIAADSAINVATEHPEFRAWRWIEPANFEIAWLPPMKKDVYRSVFSDFFGIAL